MVPDEDFDHSVIGEDRLEEGIVHGGSGIGGTTISPGSPRQTNGWMGRYAEKTSLNSASLAAFERQG